MHYTKTKTPVLTEEFATMSKSEMQAYIDKHGEMNVAETCLDARYDDVEQLANDLGCNCYRYRDMDLFNRNLYAGAFHFCK